MANGYVLWKGASPFDGEEIVAVATMRSSNRKTGDMAQVWIMPADVSPVLAVRTGQDASACGSCPLRGEQGKHRACYVQLGKAPLSVWRAYEAGRYVDARLLPPADIGGLFAGMYVRLGAWGDPAFLPYDLVAAIVSQAAGWTGYTHQWPDVDAAFADFLMASVETSEQRWQARALGYRCFFVVPSVADDSSVPGAMQCAAVRKERPLQCRQCLACSGTRRGSVATAVDVAITAHGAGKEFV
jgi:hypothetical protein